MKSPILGGIGALVAASVLLTPQSPAFAKTATDSDSTSLASGKVTVMYSVSQCASATAYKITYTSFVFDRAKSSAKLTFQGGAWWTEYFGYQCDGRPSTAVSKISAGKAVAFGRDSKRPNHAEYTFSPSLPYVTDAPGRLASVGAWASLKDSNGSTMCLSVMKLGTGGC